MPVVTAMKASSPRVSVLTRGVRRSHVEDSIRGNAAAGCTLTMFEVFIIIFLSAEKGVTSEGTIVHCQGRREQEGERKDGTVVRGEGGDRAKDTKRRTEETGKR